MFSELTIGEKACSLLRGWQFGVGVGGLGQQAVEGDLAARIIARGQSYSAIIEGVPY
jgi:hypothetical protein